MQNGFDLVVVGAGPGGMGTAYYAARLGLRVLLVEKDRFPRDRVCGDGMLAQTVAEMERLGLGDYLAEEHHGVIEGFNIRTKTARFSEGLPPDPRASRGYVVRRSEFEPKIMERTLAAGATLREGVEARRVLRSPAGETRGIELLDESGAPEQIPAPMVVTAGGWGGFEGGRQEGLAAMVVSRQYFSGLPDPGLPQRNLLQVWFTADIESLGVGYGRIFYLNDGSANVGVAVYGHNLPGEPAAREAALRRLHERFLAEPEVAEMLDGAEPEEEMASRTFASSGYGVSRSEAGLLKVGDAGGTSHPVSGEGIGFALEAGRLAAGWAHEAHRRRDFSAALLSGYARQIKGLHSLRQPTTQGLVSLVNRLPRLDLMEPVFERCPSDERLRRTLAECLAGNRDAGVMLRRHPATVARAVGAAVRRVVART
ncbi:FAD-dependent oxidoreductase [Rubrobacter marinus]|uniref:FAD-dependent oxidoreductase n=1 Tax=Rubrobacter marinus TaxID=2653852 RepID=A0A6G8Q119_9ACTN|nr:NAD(P)/FAD-dependent oxidoreductase [Rubrobacter marinus]QIN80163.1 FAD-dependent oxidoreductase [Rubrobacter marinus]